MSRCLTDSLCSVTKYHHDPVINHHAVVCVCHTTEVVCNGCKLCVGGQRAVLQGCGLCGSRAAQICLLTLLTTVMCRCHKFLECLQFLHI